MNVLLFRMSTYIQFWEGLRLLTLGIAQRLLLGTPGLVLSLPGFLHAQPSDLSSPWQCHPGSHLRHSPSLCDSGN